MKKTTRKDAGMSKKRMRGRPLDVVDQFVGITVPLSVDQRRAVKRAINRAVKEERERCLDIVARNQHLVASKGYDAIASSIRTTK